MKALLSFGKVLEWSIFKELFYGSLKDKIAGEMQMIEIWLVKLQKEVLRLPQRLPGPLMCCFKIRICVFSSSSAGESAGPSKRPAPLKH